MNTTNLARGSAEFLQAQYPIYKHIFSFISSLSLECAVQLSIPEIINSHNQPMTLPNLVSALRLPRSKTGHVHRLMRLLVHNGWSVKLLKTAEVLSRDRTPLSMLEAAQGQQ
uniref:O-methyltransferase dimerisation domain-containing protein n=1 Tax=Kalanchoe fedtschenkoi TaxID=63787 RepID=A0A7N0UYX1_KALFE